MENLTGKQFGPYQIVAPLGEGGMAAVYKAYQPAMERYVALKVLPHHFAKDPQFVARFQREAKLLAQLQHPHILPVFDYGQTEGYAYIVMPFIQSGTLTDLLNGQPLPLPRIRQIIVQVGDALNYAHTHGMIHRDVKPSNVLIDEGGNCLLTDFGLARMVEASVNLTSSGAIMGTPAYMSPEQGSGQKVDARSDIYSLGVILYEMATGRVPYKAETPIAVIFKHIQDSLPPARLLNPELPEAVELVILKALSKSLEDRYQTAGDMVRAIQEAIPDSPTVSPEVAAHKATIARVETPPTRRIPAWSWGILIIAIVLAVGTISVNLWAQAPKAVPLASVMSTSLPISSPSPTNTAEISVTRDFGPQAEQARTFAEPILDTVAQYKPDFEDDFSKVNPVWKFGGREGFSSAIEEGVARLRINQGEGFISESNYLTKKDFVLQFDARLVSGDTTSKIMVTLHSYPETQQLILELYPSLQNWSISGDLGGLMRSGEDNAVSPVGETMQITMIIRSTRFALYLNQTPISLIDDENINLILIGNNSTRIFFHCESDSPAVCEFDNVKFWNLANISGLP